MAIIDLSRLPRGPVKRWLSAAMADLSTPKLATRTRTESETALRPRIAKRLEAAQRLAAETEGMVASVAAYALGEASSLDTEGFDAVARACGDPAGRVKRSPRSRTPSMCSGAITNLAGRRVHGTPVGTGWGARRAGSRRARRAALVPSSSQVAAACRPRAASAQDADESSKRPQRVLLIDHEDLRWVALVERRKGHADGPTRKGLSPAKTLH